MQQDSGKEQQCRKRITTPVPTLIPMRMDLEATEPRRKEHQGTLPQSTEPRGAEAHPQE